jgi:ABC-type transport system involved in resistance to organic solvents, ATPase component
MRTHVHTGTAEPPADPREVVLQVRHLYKSFGANQVLSDFNFTLYRGENVVVLGKSGSGKSVLIKCIIGLMKPDSGAIHLLGKEVTTLNHDELDKLRARVGFLFQSNALYDSMTVRQNLLFPLRRTWMKQEHYNEDEMVRQALKDVGLEHTMEMMPAELSGGMRKRIALARTLIMRPEIILYDEPTTGLDPITGREIVDLIVAIQKKYRASSVIISHDMTCVRLASDRVVMLIDGKCYAEGTYDELQRSDDPKVKQFFE